ncbi:hypothetical protein A2165_02290 [Candidatus Curtissbacteria bacterium RBG_13_40_7]|uniref:Uncharacterized protein n=1 Tax=Candidatus Curtissbacteria bacterium RBG_13_40_7 TaxID=1797706 RepID=A0A1F5FYF2_9BACT|nr:MAG: hypothetical protein A2165_02290 [Candidatus Curtissbacteria bacterium RBG_13_40_7]
MNEINTAGELDSVTLKEEARRLVDEALTGLKENPDFVQAVTKAYLEKPDLNGQVIRFETGTVVYKFIQRLAYSGSYEFRLMRYSQGQEQSPDDLEINIGKYSGSNIYYRSQQPGQQSLDSRNNQEAIDGARTLLSKLASPAPPDSTQT